MNRKIIIAMGLLVFLLTFFGFGQPANAQSSPLRKPIAFDTQLATFKQLGFEFNRGITESVIEGLRKQKGIEEKPYSILYMELGRTIQESPWTPLTDRCWDFDVEAIEDHGDYAKIIENLGRISRGAIKFENVKDYVDVEEGKAWVSFKLNGIGYKWSLKVDNDWVDEELFTKIAQLTIRHKIKGRYTYFNTGGQNAVIGFETHAKRDEIIKATGLKIEWLG